MKTYCLSCKKHTNKVIRQASKCANCIAEKSRFLKQKSNNKTSWDKSDPKFMTY